MPSGVSAAWREVKTICLSLISLALAGFVARQKWLAGVALGLLGWVIYFFRDPDRLVPTASVDFILAPADGRVTKIDLVDEPHFIKGPARRISIFLSLFDVHVQRIPYEGQVQFLRYQSGGFAPAFLDELSDNETNLIGLNTSRGRIVVKQIAGILARRIVCWVDLDDQVRTGQRLGLIKFGSRVEVLLPPAVEVLVEVGQQVYGSQTIVARWP